MTVRTGAKSKAGGAPEVSGASPSGASRAPAKRSAKPSPAEEFAALRETIRAAGLRNTGPRIAVLRELERASAPLSHSEIAERVQDAGFDRATVYRNLIDLTEAGLARRTDHGDHVWRFERARSESGEAMHKHPHFVCVDCGIVSCLPSAAVVVAPVAGAPKSLRADVDVQVKGHCDTCAE